MKNLKNFNWQITSQLFSYAAAIISALVSFFNNRKNNKTIKEIELTKQKFAQENEKLKRQQAKEDYRNQLITNFLGSINAYQPSQEVWDNCTKAISEATNKFSLLATKKEDK